MWRRTRTRTVQAGKQGLLYHNRGMEQYRLLPKGGCEAVSGRRVLSIQGTPLFSFQTTLSALTGTTVCHPDSDNYLSCCTCDSVALSAVVVPHDQFLQARRRHRQSRNLKRQRGQALKSSPLEDITSKQSTLLILTSPRRASILDQSILPCHHHPRWQRRSARTPRQCIIPCTRPLHRPRNTARLPHRRTSILTPVLTRPTHRPVTLMLTRADNTRIRISSSLIIHTPTGQGTCSHLPLPSLPPRVPRSVSDLRRRLCFTLRLARRSLPTSHHGPARASSWASSWHSTSAGSTPRYSGRTI